MKSYVMPVGLLSLGFAVAGCANSSGSHQESSTGEEHEVKVAMQDVPAAVQTTLKREANGQTINTVDKEMRHGKTVYEADAKIDGNNYEIVVDETGRLLSKKLDNEENETAEKGEGQEHKEKGD